MRSKFPEILSNPHFTALANFAVGLRKTQVFYGLYFSKTWAGHTDTIKF